MPIQANDVLVKVVRHRIGKIVRDQLVAALISALGVSRGNANLYIVKAMEDGILIRDATDGHILSK